MKMSNLLFCRRVLCIGFSVLLAASVFGAAGAGGDRFSGPSGGSLDTQWGPDVYGYLAKDSNQPGGPTYQWVDIRPYGTQVSGLTDDNFVGPFNIGWGFHYYWYDVSQFWVGSNGYMKFQPVGQLASPFPDFPNPTVPNDVIGPYVGDLVFGPTEPGVCYYWSNGADSLIVMWEHVRAWNLNGNTGDHNFEVILCGADSSFTFMYAPSTTGDLNSNDIHVGFENVTGLIGLQMYGDTYPPSNYAIKAYYPPVVTFAVHDLAVAGVQNQGSMGFFMLPGQVLTPWMAVRNAGNQTESSYLARYSVRQVSNNALLAVDDTTMGVIVPSQTDNILFPPLWTAGATGLFRTVGRVTLSGDGNNSNDSVRTELHVVTLPGELYYDDGAYDYGQYWIGGTGGIANQFVPPAYPVQITQVRIYAVNTGPFTAQILDDDGPGGAPGTIVWSQAVPNPIGFSWTTLGVPAGAAVFSSGSFYVAWMTQGPNGATFGMDTTATQGIARRTWEFSNSWSEYRLAQSEDAMIRATIAEVPCDATPSVYFDASPLPLHACATLCADIVTGIHVCPAPGGPPLDPAQPPMVTILPGCQTEGCNSACDPATYAFDPANWIFNPTTGCWENAIMGVTDGCVCISLEGFLAVKLNSFSAVPGDAQVALIWSTAAEPENDHFELERDGVLMARIAAHGSPTSGAEYSWTDRDVVNGRTYRYALVGVNLNGQRAILATDSATPSLNAAAITEYALYQNYPNPFNATTSIVFDLPQRGFVSLKVYNLAGQEVAMLRNGVMPLGRHSVSFNMGGLPSGVYIAQIESGEFKASTKLLLLR